MRGLSALNSQLVLTQLGDGNPEDACDAYCKLALQLHSEVCVHTSQLVLTLRRVEMLMLLPPWLLHESSFRSAHSHPKSGSQWKRSFDMTMHCSLKIGPKVLEPTVSE